MSTITPVSPSPVTATPSTVPVAIPPMFKNAAEWLHALGDVPLDRIVFDPWPGTATEQDMVRISERERLVELLDGTLVEKRLGFYESAIGSLVVTALTTFVIPRKLGVVAGEQAMSRTVKGRVRMPDACFKSFARMPGGKLSREAISPVSPDLIVEVISEGNTKLEIDQKLSEFFAAGTRLAWVVDPRTMTAEIYHHSGAPDATLRDGDSLDGEDVLPGFTLPLHDLFHTYD